MKLNVPSLLVELIFGLVAVSSFVVWAMICSRVRRRQPLLPYRPRQSRSANVFAVWLAAVWIANHFFVAIMSEPGQPSLQGVQSDCALKLMLMCLLLIMLTRLGQQPLFEFGLHLTALRQQAADGLLGFLASLLPVFLVLVLTLGFRSEETQHPLLRFAGSKPWSVRFALDIPGCCCLGTIDRGIALPSRSTRLAANKNTAALGYLRGGSSVQRRTRFPRFPTVVPAGHRSGLHFLPATQFFVRRYNAWSFQRDHAVD